MVDSIKITELQNIGASIAYTTLVPVVNMAGTPITQKSTLQNLGNLILNGAGGSYFAPAARAILSQSVTNAAQPNITSVGTLTSLTVAGTGANVNGTLTVTGNIALSGTDISLGAVGNLRITGGTSGQVLSTNGNGVLSWTSTVGNMVAWTTAPVANTSAGIAGQAAYDAGGNLYVCVNANTWAKFAGTTSW
jgi:hypothetical protein